MGYLISATEGQISVMLGALSRYALRRLLASRVPTHVGRDAGPEYLALLLALSLGGAAPGRGEGQPQDDASRDDHYQAPPQVDVEPYVGVRLPRSQDPCQDYRDAVDQDDGRDVEAYRHGVVRTRVLRYPLLLVVFVLF